MLILNTGYIIFLKAYLFRLIINLNLFVIIKFIKLVDNHKLYQIFKILNIKLFNKI